MLTCLPFLSPFSTLHAYSDWSNWKGSGSADGWAKKMPMDCEERLVCTASLPRPPVFPAMFVAVPTAHTNNRLIACTCSGMTARGSSLHNFSAC